MKDAHEVGIAGRSVGGSATHCSFGIFALAALCMMLAGCAGAIGSAGTPAPLSATTSDISVPPTFFGQHIHHLSATCTDCTTPWPSLAFGTWRFWDNAYWANIETARGVFDWSRLDGNLAAAQAHGIGDVVFTFGYTPLWASSNPAGTCGALGPGRCYPPADNPYWTEFVTAIVQHACGKIKYYEIWNEPNLSEFWSGTKTELVTLASLAYPIIKDPANCACNGAVCSPGELAGKNPNVVLSPSISTLNGNANIDWFNDYLAGGGKNYLDIVAFHGYGYASDPESIRSGLDNFEVALAINGLAAKDLWDTEGSWGRSSDLTDETMRIAWVAKAHLVEWSKGVSPHIWYAYDGDGWGDLWSSTDGLLREGVAYGEVYKWMQGAKLMGCDRDQTDTWTCSITRASPPGYRGWVVWNRSSATMYRKASAATQYRDLAGHVIAPLPAIVAVDRTPFLFETQSAW